MGLEIERLSKGDSGMASGTVAAARVYRTVTGKLVKEGDPRGAFLAYGQGQDVHAGEVEEYKALMGDGPAESGDKGTQAQADPNVRDELRRRQAGDVRTQVNTTPALVHDRLATELADEQREIANRGSAAVADAAQWTDRTVATQRVLRTDSGDLVPEGHPDGRFLAYPEGATVQDADVDAYRKLQKDADRSAQRSADASAAEAKDDPKRGPQAPNKGGPVPPNK